MARRRSPFSYRPSRRSSFAWHPPRRRSAGTEATAIAAILALVAVVWVVQNLWPLLVLGFLAWAGWEVYAQAERGRRIRALDLAAVDGMNGAQFEAYLVSLFRHHGYRAQHTGQAGDQGCDLLLEKDGRRIACQAKRYRRQVANDAVAEAVAAKAIYGCDDAMVVTTAYFSNGARRLAQANGCRLVDRDDLAELIRAFQAGERNG